MAWENTTTFTCHSQGHILLRFFLGAGRNICRIQMCWMLCAFHITGQNCCYQCRCLVPPTAGTNINYINQCNELFLVVWEFKYDSQKDSYSWPIQQDIQTNLLDLILLIQNCGGFFSNSEQPKKILQQLCMLNTAEKVHLETKHRAIVSVYVYMNYNEMRQFFLLLLIK